MRDKSLTARGLRVLSLGALALAISVSSCSGEENANDHLDSIASRVVGQDTFLYFRCNATGWGVDSNTRLLSTSNPNVFTLDYQVTQPWMVTGFDTCTVVETNQLNGWGSVQHFFDISGGVLSAPNTWSLVPEQPGGDYHFQVRYPATGNFTATVNFATKTLSVGTPQEMAELGDANGDGTINITDSLVVAQFVAGQNPMPFFANAADADCDGDIDSGDADLIAEFVVGIVPGLECPAYRGLMSFDPFEEPVGLFDTYTSEHFTVYSRELVDGTLMARFLANVEACYDLQIVFEPEWEARTEFQAGLGLSSKTIGFVNQTCGAGCGNTLRVEVPSGHDLTQLGTRDNSWVFYYEMQRQGGIAYGWYQFLTYEPANTDWNSAFAHSMAITCSEAIGAGPFHENVGIVNGALPAWIALPSQQPYADFVASGTNLFIDAMGNGHFLNDLFGAMLAEMYRQFGLEYFQEMIAELENPTNGYPIVQTARDQACNFLLASGAVTGGASTATLINDWRFPDDC